MSRGHLLAATRARTYRVGSTSKSDRSPNHSSSAFAGNAGPLRALRANYRLPGSNPTKCGSVRVGDHPPGTHKTVRNLSWKRASGGSRQPKIMTRKIGEHWPVGSRTGAVFRRSGLAVSPRFLWECLSSQTVNPFPAPATSHPACGFPALGAPVCLCQGLWGYLTRRAHRNYHRGHGGGR